MTAARGARVSLCAAVAAGSISTVVVGALLTATHLVGLPGWLAATAVLLGLAVAAGTRAGPRRGALREVLGVGAGAATGVMVFGFAYALWGAISRSLLRTSLLWSDRVGGVLLREVIAALVLAALALLLLLRPATALLPGHGGPGARLLFVASLGASAGGTVAAGVQLVRHEWIPFLLPATLVSIGLVAVAAAVCRVRRSDALVLLAGAVLLHGGGLLLEGSLLRHDTVMSTVEQLLPSTLVAVLVLAAAPALRRHEPSL